jgi:hypothetical protein
VIPHLTVRRAESAWVETTRKARLRFGHLYIHKQGPEGRSNGSPVVTERSEGARGLGGFSNARPEGAQEILVVNLNYIQFFG